MPRYLFTLSASLLVAALAFAQPPAAPNQTPKGTCPKGGDGEYTFRNRKQIEATAESGSHLETKRRCKDCNHEWKERVPGVLQKPPPCE